FSKASRGDDLQSGRDKLSREMRKHSLGISSAQSMRAIKTVADHMGYKEADEMLVNIGTGKESATHVANRLLKILVDRGTEEAATPGFGVSDISTGKMPPMLTSVQRPKKHETHASNGIVVKGIDEVLVRLSRCCNPVPGDDIIGFVTRGRGVTVHRADCPNAKDLMLSPERIIDVFWENAPTKSTSYQIELYIEAIDRLRLLNDITAVLSDAGTNVVGCTLNTHHDGMAEMRVVIQVSETSLIEKTINEVKQIEGVFDVRRMMSGGTMRKKDREGIK
ncbi:MAG: DUF5913 domain-containing protein, partial [Eggerthellaceae bacterium]|nr:DUF5913 domain-containing protein [Eggerthellaceae bacterium]